MLWPELNVKLETEIQNYDLEWTCDDVFFAHSVENYVDRWLKQ